MTRPVSISKKPRKQHTPEFRNGTLRLTERVGAVATTRELSLYEPQLYAWRSKQQQQMGSSERESEPTVENARLKRQLAEQAEGPAILQKAAISFAKRLKRSVPSSKIVGQSSASKRCVVYFGLPAATGISGSDVVTR